MQFCADQSHLLTLVEKTSDLQPTHGERLPGFTGDILSVFVGNASFRIHFHRQYLICFSIAPLAAITSVSKSSIHCCQGFLESLIGEAKLFHPLHSYLSVRSKDSQFLLFHTGILLGKSYSPDAYTFVHYFSFSVQQALHVTDNRLTISSELSPIRIIFQLKTSVVNALPLHVIITIQF